MKRSFKRSGNKSKSMAKILPLYKHVYVVLGIDEYEHDKVLGVFDSYQRAKQYCVKSLVDTEYLDTWIEKHPVM